MENFRLDSFIRRSDATQIDDKTPITLSPGVYLGIYFAYVFVAGRFGGNLGALATITGVCSTTTIKARRVVGDIGAMGFALLHQRERSGSFRMSFGGSLLQPVSGLFRILRRPFAKAVHFTELQLRIHIPRLG
ncbi:hypothetical protein D3C81_1551200 [compost metagenome]